MDTKDKKLTNLAQSIFNEACKTNQKRDQEISQGIKGEKEHARTTLSWIQKLVEKPSIEVQIAGFLHDIDRIITPGFGGGFGGSRKSKEYEKYKKAHAKRSAVYVYEKLLDKGTIKPLAKRVKFLISHHDDTGKELEAFNDKELNALAAADSFAFFTSVAPKLYQKEGEQRLKDKIAFMVEKMSNHTRDLLKKHRLDNKLFDKLKNEVLKEYIGHES